MNDECIFLCGYITRLIFVMPVITTLKKLGNPQMGDLLHQTQERGTIPYLSTITYFNQDLGQEHSGHMACNFMLTPY